MIYVMFAMAISTTNGITSITTAEFNSKFDCEQAIFNLTRDFTRTMENSGSPQLKIKCLPKGE